MADQAYEQEYYTVSGGKGPTTTVVAGIHGDETPTTDVAKELVEEITTKDVEGTVNVIPRANLFACLENQRETPWPKYETHESEERNMNRAFGAAVDRLEGGDTDLNLTESMAYNVLTVVEESDYVIDMHTATWPDAKTPQSRYKVSAEYDGEVIDEMDAMAEASGLDMLLETTPSEIGGGVLGAAGPEIGVPTVTIEIGGAAHFSEADRDLYRQAIEGILSHAGHLSDGQVPADPERYDGLERMTADRSGALERQYELGDLVDAGSVIATVRDPSGAVVDEVEAPRDGRVESLNMGDRVNQYSRVGKLAYRT